MALPENLIIIDSTDPADIKSALQAAQLPASAKLHGNNGTYMYPQALIVPTTLAAYEYLSDASCQPEDAFFVAVNSDKSMADTQAKDLALAQAKVDSKEDPQALEKHEKKYAQLTDQRDRAQKVASPLARQHPNRRVFVFFYDEQTPEELYQFLSGEPAPLGALFKYGYGTYQAPGIVGGQYFESVIAHPLINDLRPVCADLTAPGTKAPVLVVPLHQASPTLPSPYLTLEGKTAFALLDAADNQAYADPAAKPKASMMPALSIARLKEAALQDAANATGDTLHPGAKAGLKAK